MSPETESSPAAATRPHFVHRHGRKLVVLSLWLFLLGGYQIYAWRAGLTPLEIVHYLVDFMAASMAGALVYMALYTVCPLVLFPVGLLAVASGFVFGPVEGVILTLLASNVSASIAYLLGRYFGKGLLGSEKATGVVGRCAERMRTNGFESVLITRFTFLPFDLVNYLAGFLRIGWKPFILASVLGSLPGTVSLVLFGASISMDFTEHTMGLNPWMLLASISILAVCLSLSWYLKQREWGSAPLSAEPGRRD